MGKVGDAVHEAEGLREELDQSIAENHEGSAHRDDAPDEHLRVRLESREGEEDGEDRARSAYKGDVRAAREEIGREAEDSGEETREQKIEEELLGTELLLYGCPEKRRPSMFTRRWVRFAWTNM